MLYYCKYGVVNRLYVWKIYLCICVCVCVCMNAAAAWINKVYFGQTAESNEKV